MQFDGVDGCVGVCRVVAAFKTLVSGPITCWSRIMCSGEVEYVKCLYLP